MMTENDLLRTTCTALRTENFRLREEVRALAGEAQTLRGEDTRLHAALDAAHRSYWGLVARNYHLDGQVEQLEASLQTAEADDEVINYLECENDRLHERIERLEFTLFHAR